MGRILFGFRDDIDLNQRWWHRLAKVVVILLMTGWILWAAVNFPADLPTGQGHERIVETLEDFVKSHPEDGDPVASFASKYRFRSGQIKPDGTVGFLFFETSLYCAVHPYDHLNSLVSYLRPT